MAVKPLWIAIALGLVLFAWRSRKAGRALRIFLLVLAALAGSFAVGLIHPPTLEEVVKEVGGRLGDWAYLVVGVNAFLETGAFLGFVAPGETVVLFGGVLAGEGVLDLKLLMLITWACAFCGDITAYTIGRRAGRDFLLRHGRRVKIGEPQVAFVERVFERRGRSTLLLGRWVGVVRPLVPFLAGASRMKVWEFLLIDLISVAIWSIGLCLLAATFWQNFDELVSLVGRAMFIIGTLIVVVVGTSVGVGAWRVPERHAQVTAWIAEQRRDRPALARPASALWLLMGRLSALLPNRRRPAPVAAATVEPPAAAAAPQEPVEP